MIYAVLYRRSQTPQVQSISNPAALRTKHSGDDYPRSGSHNYHKCEQDRFKTARVSSVERSTKFNSSVGGGT